MKDELINHLRYTGWATRRHLDAAAGLSPEELSRPMNVSHGSLLGTLAHIFAGDRVWLSRLADAEPRMTLFDSGEEPTLDLLQREWPAVLDRWVEWATENDPTGVIHYTDTKGNPYHSPAWQIVRHVVNHGTYHRGQVSALLRQLGRVPPPTDLIFYYRSQ